GRIPPQAVSADAPESRRITASGYSPYGSGSWLALRVVGESFGRLQKELAWKGETRGQGKHDKQLDRQP
ncbi:hypothetical protein ACXHII_004536, partial [Pseudomonas aeruginosa]